MSQQVQKEFDPDLPNANAVLASLCCVAARYASHPSLDLAKLAATLAHRLMAPQYAESELVVEVAKRLAKQWDAIVYEQNEVCTQMTFMQPASGAVH